MLNESWYLVVPDPLLSTLIWLFVAASLLYLAREPAHRVLLSLSRLLHGGFRLAARSVHQAEQRLTERNRAVLLCGGREAVERMIEREFERIEAILQRDLAEYPALQRKLAEQIDQLEGEYRQSLDVPPAPAAWTKAVEEVAKIPAKSDPMVRDILEDIHGSLAKAHERALESYRKASGERHQRLGRMMPMWRKLQQVLSRVERDVQRLHERASALGAQFDRYQAMRNEPEDAVRALSASALAQFFIAGMVLAIATGGAIINFHLIARPMAEMVGGSSLLGGFRTADIAALVIILVEMSMGLFLMETLRITNLFPVIGSLHDGMRRRMGWIAFLILLSLASIEAGLAYLRETLMLDELATSALLRGDADAEFQSEFLWITTAAQMGMGFILPFALTFVAIPLESFIHSLRAVLGLIGVGLLRLLAHTLRLLGNFSRHGGQMLTQVYDVLIFLPLWVEGWLNRRRATNPPTGMTPLPARLEDDDPEPVR